MNTFKINNINNNNNYNTTTTTTTKGSKVTDFIAEARGVQPGVDCHR